MPHSSADELSQPSSLIAVPSLLPPPALYRQYPPNRSDPSRPRVTCCEVEPEHAVEIAEPPLTARHLPAMPEVTGLPGIVHAWLVEMVHGCAVSCVLLVVLELGSVMQSPVAGLTIAPASPVSTHSRAELLAQLASPIRWWPAELAFPRM